MSKYNWQLKVNKKTVEEFEDLLYARAVKSGEHLRDEIVKKLSGSGSGKTYTVPGTSTSHRASAPGEPPAKLTGWLANNVETKTERDKRVIDTYVGIRGGPDGVPYARRLEYGFHGKDDKGRTYNQAPRPYFEPAYHEQKGEIKRIIKG